MNRKMRFSNYPIDIKDTLNGKKEAVAKALNLVESRNPLAAEDAKKLIESLSERARAERHAIGITGPPGVGKSTLISKIIEKYRMQEKTVGIISIDPSSRKSGGALLGDRVRFSYDPNDPGVFIRSMATGYHMGGLAWNTRRNLTIFEAVYDKIIIETVGVGQSETEIDLVVDSVVFVVQPGSGDSLQFMKAGIMEIPDILVINKSDQKNLAIKTFYDLKNASGFDHEDNEKWRSAIVMTSAMEGSGIDDLILHLENHEIFLRKNDIAKRRKKKWSEWIVMAFIECFGKLGLELMGGEEAIIRMIEQAQITNPFVGMRVLNDKMEEILHMKFSCLF